MRLLPLRSRKATNAAGRGQPGHALVAADDGPIPLALLEFQSPTAAVIATPVPLIARFTIIWITLLFFACMFLAAVIPIDEEVSSQGQLISSAPTITVAPFTESIVKSINVQSGQFVKKGTVLATLDPTYATADYTAYKQQQQAYSAEVERLKAQEAGTPYNADPANPQSPLQEQTYVQQQGQYNFTVDDYTQKIKQLQQQIDGFNEQAAYDKQRLGIASNVESMRQSLQQLQVGSRLDTLSATDDRLQIQADLSQNVSSAQAAQRQLASQQAELQEFTQQWLAQISQQLSDALNSLYQAQQNLSKAQLNNQLVVLTAPQDSVVLSIAQVAVGSVTQSGTPLMQIVPANAPLSVQALIDGSTSGYVAAGNEVVIKLNTLSFTTFGDASGIVQSVSPSSFNPQAAQGGGAGGITPSIPGAPNDLYYQANISLEILNLHNVPKGFVLMPGMPLEADVKIGRRTILEYFARRVMPIAYNSLHEP